MDNKKSKIDSTTHEAWIRLEKQLQKEEASPLWQQWAAQEQAGRASTENHTQLKEATPAAQASSPSILRPQLHLAAQGGLDKEATKPAVRRSWLKRHSAKVGMATAAAVLAVVIAAPSTNQALAALLNKFRMEQVVVVQEDDIEQMFNSIFYSESDTEATNKFGVFEHTTTGEHVNKLTPQQVQEQFGLKIPALQLGEKTQLDLSSGPAQQLTFRPKVDEINKLMKKLGAEKLLPESIHDKPITLQTERTLSVNYQQAGQEQGKHVSLSYVAIPTLEIDPSIDAQDAYEAVIRFPVIPDHLRNALAYSTKLDDGQVPLPLITDGKADKITIGGLDLYISQPSEDSSDYWSVVWKQDDMMVYASFNKFTERAEVEELLAQLVQA
ncbi:hypothetical protein ACFO9Q_09955 [Paenibacillus sp. GCM10023252]|uniref:hypothetical protein n=1 Tax=Paenibacillus sp. GCM10023252 TaxID=3252649 RepID=UPI00360F09C9